MDCLAGKPIKHLQVSSADTSMIEQVGISGAFAKDFISWAGMPERYGTTAMELRHLRYFVAVAEEGSLTLAAEKRLHTAQPSLSRQIRDLEYEVGVQLMTRSVHGIELTTAGRAFLDHARLALTQAEAATEAARRAAQPPRALFAIGFLTGYEMDWLPAVMEILRAELPSTEVVVHSQDSPDLAAGLIRGKIDLAFLRPEKQASGLKFRLLQEDPLIVLMPHDHALAARNSIRPQDIVGQTFIGVSPVRAPNLWAAVNDYLKPLGVKPDHQAENLAMAISLVASTGGISLLPLYSQNLLPKTVVSRPMRGAPPMVDLVIGYNEANTSPLLKIVLSKVDDLKFRVTKSSAEKS
jgi:LysR family hca operon transcriptional activator